MPTGQKLLDSLAETWDFFFSDVLPTLQAIFYPVQVSGPGSYGTPGPPRRPSLVSLQTVQPEDGHPPGPRRHYGCVHLGTSRDLSEPVAHPGDGNEDSSLLRAR